MARSIRAMVVGLIAIILSFRNMNRDWKTVEVAPRAFGEGSREVVVHCVGLIPTVPIR